MNHKNKFRYLFCLILLLFVNNILVAQNAIIKVACIGNSVTYGYKINDRDSNSYPAQLQRLLGNKYEIKNFGHSGATLLKKGHNPYYKIKEFSDAIQKGHAENFLFINISI